MKEDTIVTSLRFPREIYKKIKEMAHRDRRNISQQIAYLCEQAMQEEQREEQEAPCT